MLEHPVESGATNKENSMAKYRFRYRAVSAPEKTRSTSTIICNDVLDADDDDNAEKKADAVLNDVKQRNLFGSSANIEPEELVKIIRSW